MMKKYGSLLIASQLVLLSLLLPACNAPANLGAKMTASPIPTEPIPTQTRAAEPVELEPCALLTEKEVSQSLGGPVQAQPAQGTGGCTYMRTSTDPSHTVQLVLSAAQGDEAKTLTLLGIGLLAGFGGDPNMSTKMEAMNRQIDESSLSGLIAQVAGLFQGTSVAATLSETAGESRLWLLYEGDSYTQGTLILVRGEEYISLTQIGGDLSAAPDQLARLGDLAFKRLPPAFFVPNQGNNGSFGFEGGTGQETEASATAIEPGLAPAVAGGLVWATAPNAGMVYAIDPATNTVIKQIAAKPFPGDTAVAAGKVWVQSQTTGVVWQIDAQSFQIIRTFQFNGNTANLDASADALWLAGQLGVRMIDLTTGTRYDVVYNACYDVAIGDDAIWVSQTADRQLLDISPESRKVVATVKLDGQPTWTAYGDGFVWTVLQDKKDLVAINAATRQVEHRQSFEFVINGLAIGSGRLRFSNPATLGSIEPGSWSTAGIHPSTLPTRIIYFAGSLWATGANSGLVTRYDPDSGRTLAEIQIGTDPTGIAGGE
jgi:DNA-binding beta-propeller fold protein YncE